MQIAAIRVADSSPGNGLGTAMLESALSEGRRLGARWLSLSSDASRVDADRPLPHARRVQARWARAGRRQARGNPDSKGRLAT
jgi:hypothetical protein